MHACSITEGAKRFTAIEGPSASTEVGTAPAIAQRASPRPGCRTSRQLRHHRRAAPADCLSLPEHISGLTCAFWMVRTSSNKAVKRILSSKIPQGTWRARRQVSSSHYLLRIPYRAPPQVTGITCQHHLAVGKGLTLLAAHHDRNQRAGCDCCRRERARVAQERLEGALVCHVPVFLSFVFSPGVRISEYRSIFFKKALPAWPGQPRRP